MLPRISRIQKKGNYPQDQNYQNTNNILKLKLIRQFLEKEHTDKFSRLKIFIPRKAQKNQTLKQPRNRHRLASQLAQINTNSSSMIISKFLNANISSSGRNLRLSQLYDGQKGQLHMSEQLKRSFTNCKVR